MIKNNLFVQAIGLLLFLPAGSLQYWQGWLLMGILFVPMFCAGLVMMSKNPELLRKRLNARERAREEKAGGLQGIQAEGEVQSHSFYLVNRPK